MKRAPLPGFEDSAQPTRLVWFPRLLRATPEQRSKSELLGEGDGIHWPLIDEDLSVECLLAGRRSRSA